MIWVIILLWITTMVYICDNRTKLEAKLDELKEAWKAGQNDSTKED